MTPNGDGWRREADEAWLAAHRSANFAAMRRRFRRLGFVGDAVSHAELGPLGGAPRNPELKVPGRRYSVVRYVEHHISHTAIEVDLDRCRRCGHRLVEVHRVRQVGADGVRRAVGAVRACRRCQAGSWLFLSHMPAVVHARARDAKVVL